MKNITMIAAIGKNNELGKDGNLIWRFPEDMSFFRSTTMGKPIVMGMKTFKSLPRLLPGRKHIVLTRKNPELDPSVLVVHSIEELLEKVDLYDEVMVIGGATIYSQMLKHSNRLILTEIDASAECDVYFPEFSKKEWNRVQIGSFESNKPPYKRYVYTRK